MCIRDRYQRRVHGELSKKQSIEHHMENNAGEALEKTRSYSFHATSPTGMDALKLEDALRKQSMSPRISNELEGSMDMKSIEKRYSITNSAEINESMSYSLSQLALTEEDIHKKTVLLLPAISKVDSLVLKTLSLYSIPPDVVHVTTGALLMVLNHKTTLPSWREIKCALSQPTHLMTKVKVEFLLSTPNEILKEVHSCLEKNGILNKDVSGENLATAKILSLLQKLIQIQYLQKHEGAQLQEKKQEII
eukprot:TRINITY_DN5103_c0_g5_i4.p1 TRINITY_DN5103_c0_g5~~TRINITY_DN5103_c0_g5_i4.p1  ORF type:complete len:249 (+),score=46.74 TRINITY_DN5103_c0_g5_i4:67-813(+)